MDQDLQTIVTKIGQRVRELRKAKGISQLELAAMCGMEPSNLNRIERGHTNPTLRSLYLIASALEIPVVNLVK